MSAVASRWAWFVVLLLGSAALVLAFRFDAAAQEWVAAHRTPGCLAFMKQVSRWGDWPSHVVVGLTLAAIAYARGNRRWLRIFVAMLLACALAGAAARVIKIGAGRARPSVELSAGWNGPRMAERYHAFPSGHTAASCAFFAVLALAHWRAGTTLLVLPVLIGLSRMYVGAHHFSDVVGALLLGALVGWAVARSRFCSRTPARAREISQEPVLRAERPR